MIQQFYPWVFIWRKLTVWHDWVTELKWTENSNWKRYMSPCVHYRIIYNNQDTALKHYLQ